MADVTTATPGIAGRERVRAGRAAEIEYRTFAAHVPGVLSMVAGALGLLGALGAGIRASAVDLDAIEPEQVGVLMGHSDAAGWVLAGLAAVLLISPLAWLGRRRLPKLLATGAAIAFVALTAARVSFLNERAAEWAEAARRQPDFTGYHAGLGWGAWVLLAAALAAAFTVVVAALRTLDLRKGYPG